MRHKKTRILGVDDNPSVLDSVRLALKSVPDIEFAGSLDCADTLVEECTRLRPDLVLLDIDMPGKNPFEAMDELNEQCPETRVVMYTGHVRQELIDQAIDRGAWGYVAKADPVECLLRAIRGVAKGEFTLSRSVDAIYGS